VGRAGAGAAEIGCAAAACGFDLPAAFGDFAAAFGDLAAADGGDFAAADGADLPADGAGLAADGAGLAGPGTAVAGADAAAEGKPCEPGLAPDSHPYRDGYWIFVSRWWFAFSGTAAREDLRSLKLASESASSLRYLERTQFRRARVSVKRTWTFRRESVCDCGISLSAR
jgi:hypothetical protein